LDEIVEVGCQNSPLFYPSSLKKDEKPLESKSKQSMVQKSKTATAKVAQKENN
jgi:hypothetical protein